VGRRQRDRRGPPGPVRVDFGGLDYDFFLLFDRAAAWGRTPPRPVSSGATVIGDSDRLAGSAASLLS
jgi:hypothetical protein